MGLPNFDTQAEGVLPILVMNTVLSVVLIKNMLKSMFQIVGYNGYSMNLEEDRRIEDMEIVENREMNRKLPIIRFRNGSNSGNGDCSVCLCRLKDEEEVSELSCKHFFHKKCLEKWFENQHRTCPLCRSTF